MSKISEWNSLVSLAQEYCKESRPDTCEIAGFISWASKKFPVEELDFCAAIDLVESKMSPKDKP